MSPLNDVPTANLILQFEESITLKLKAIDWGQIVEFVELSTLAGELKRRGINVLGEIINHLQSRFPVCGGYFETEGVPNKVRFLVWHQFLRSLAIVNNFQQCPYLSESPPAAHIETWVTYLAGLRPVQ